MIELGLVMFVPHSTKVVMVYIYWDLYQNYNNEE